MMTSYAKMKRNKTNHNKILRTYLTVKMKPRKTNLFIKQNNFILKTQQNDKTYLIMYIYKYKCYIKLGICFASKLNLF